MKKKILFFSGFAMPEMAFAHLQKADFELQIFPFAPAKALEFFAAEKGIYYLIAYSLGVYQAHLWLAKNPQWEFVKKIAINGTAFAIDAKMGIDPKIFQKTIENLSEKNLNLFYKNIGFLNFENADWQKEKENLQVFQSQYQPLQNQMDAAIIATKDLIFHPKNQKLFYESKAKIPYFEIDAPHYPFQNWKNWQEIIEIAAL